MTRVELTACFFLTSLSLERRTGDSAGDAALTGTIAEYGRGFGGPTGLGCGEPARGRRHAERGVRIARSPSACCVRFWCRMAPVRRLDRSIGVRDRTSGCCRRYPCLVPAAPCDRTARAWPATGLCWLRAMPCSIRAMWATASSRSCRARPNGHNGRRDARLIQPRPTPGDQPG
jgi:hypothetical protein